MLDWLRRHLGPPPNRGSLTLLPNGGVILGAPEGATDRMMWESRRTVEDWLERGRLLVLPFPVDVVDQRER